MIVWLKRKLKQTTCKHLLVSSEPYMDPETWDMVNECGKCEKIFNYNKDFIDGKY